MITFKQQGSFKNIEKFLNNKRENLVSLLNKYGQEGVNALSINTPSDSGETARSWNYKVRISRNSFSVSWSNSHMENGIPVVILIQYGHGTKNGGYIQGRDFINPAIQPIFDRLSEEIWKGVINV